MDPPLGGSRPGSTYGGSTYGGGSDFGSGFDTTGSKNFLALRAGSTYRGGHGKLVRFDRVFWRCQEMHKTTQEAEQNARGHEVARERETMEHGRCDVRVGFLVVVFLNAPATFSRNRGFASIFTRQDSFAENF